MSPEKLLRMANQIGMFFISQNCEQAPKMIAEHLNNFWDPRMRVVIIAYARAGGAGLLPEVRLAIEQLDLNKATAKC